MCDLKGFVVLWWIYVIDVVVVCVGDLIVVVVKVRWKDVGDCYVYVVVVEGVDWFDGYIGCLFVFLCKL